MTSSYISGLKCMKCGHEQTDMEARLRCAKCNGYTQAVYDLKVARGSLSRKVVSERQGGLWRFREMLPVRSSENIVSIAEGGAPLIRSRKIGKKLGIANLYFKDLTRNPTGSFKDYSSSTSVSGAAASASSMCRSWDPRASWAQRSGRATGDSERPPRDSTSTCSIDEDPIRVPIG